MSSQSGQRRRHVHLVATSTPLQEALAHRVAMQWKFTCTADSIDVGHEEELELTEYRLLLSPPQQEDTGDEESVILLYGSQLMPHRSAASSVTLLIEAPCGLVADTAPLLMFVGEERGALHIAQEAWKRARHPPQPLLVSLANVLHLNQSWSHHVPVAAYRKRQRDKINDEDVLLLRKL